jgi:hypothetical protein
MLHMRPQALAERLAEVLAQEQQSGKPVVLVYGDCCMQMASLECKPQVARTGGLNCCELLVGKDAYRRQSREGAFFLLPEWTQRWRQVFSGELGLKQETASDLMRDMHRKLVYLDTGLSPVPTETLNACSQFCGLAWERCPTSSEPLRLAISDALTRLEKRGTTR